MEDQLTRFIVASGHPMHVYFENKFDETTLISLQDVF